MSFSEYCDIISKSVCETGYASFLPSLCTVDNGNIVMKVLDGELSIGGEEEIALNWAESFARDGRTVFLAYRQGQRTVAVLEIRGLSALRKCQIRIDSFVSAELGQNTRLA